MIFKYDKGEIPGFSRKLPWDPQTAYVKLITCPPPHFLCRDVVYPRHAVSVFYHPHLGDVPFCLDLCHGLCAAFCLLLPPTVKHIL